MKKTQLTYLLGTGLVGLLAFGLYWLTAGSLGSPQPFPVELRAHISGLTAGEISRLTPIQVRFNEAQVSADLINEPLGDDYFSFSPRIKGTTKWKDAYTLAFYPEEMLPSGQRYDASLAVGDILSGLPRDAREMDFRFATRKQGLQVELTQREVLGNSEQAFHRLHGVVRTLDVESAVKVEKLFSAQQKGNALAVRWEHEAASHVHHFVIDSLPRKEDSYLVSMLWKGDVLGLDEAGKTDVLIPSKGKFRHLHTYAYQEPEQYVVVEFSDPIKTSQNLEGLVRIEGKAARVAMEANRLKIYPTTQLTGPVNLKLEAGILSKIGQELEQPILESLTFEEAKPKVRLIGKGTILPRSESMPLVFEAIGLNAVDVRIIKIFEKNIPQFLQINQLDGKDELKRVGQVVAQTRVDLTGSWDLQTWNRHALDLGKLLEPDPGAIYEVALGFRRSYSVFACEEEGSTEESSSMLDVGEDWFTYVDNEDNSYWDYWEEDYAYGYQADPCYNQYYHPGRIVRRNVLASDLGLIAKKGDAGSLFVVTDLKTTQPMADVALEVYDYQQQLIGTMKTDAKGMVRSDFDRTPYLLIAKKGKQRGYLRLDDGSSLSMSRFDTQGKTYYKGVKGFLYAERGVWRPGDQMYVNFILEDREQQLPGEHPVRFELKDPRGQVVQQMVQTQGTNGFYAFHTATSPDAVTGNYVAEVKVGGASFRKVFKVETIVPNRLKMELDFGLPYLSKSTYDRQATLKAQWLHGAVANQLKADVQVSLQPAATTFPNYREFSFEDPVRRFYGEEITLFDGKLDASGLAQIPAKISADEDAPGQLVANFKTKVFEPGGAFSVDRFSIPYHPYDTYVGIRPPKGDAARGMLLTDIDHSVQIATVNPEGQPVSSKVEVTLYKLSWKWWWDKAEDNIGTYNGKIDAEELSSGTVQTVNGEGTWALRVNYPSWGRYLIRAVDEEGHASGRIVYIDWPGWAGRSTEGSGSGAQMLSFTADKELYEVGEAVTLNIPTGDAGRALVSIESGNRVLDAYWVDATKGTTRFSFPSTAAMSPNVYVHVSLLQPHAQTKNDLPIRMYGVIPIKVEDSKTHLRPKIAMQEELKPNANFQVAVSEATGQAMTYTVAVVDEGLLGLTRYQAPDPWKTFYQRQALDVKTWDIFDQVLGAYGGEIKSLLGVGGGADSEGPKGQKANRFEPVVMFLGPFELKAGETKTHRLKMPNYIGAVRTMVVAGDPSGSYGAVEKSSPVKQPLMVLGTLPRVLGPGERLSLPVTVFTMDEKIKLVNVSVSTGKSVMVEGKESKTMRFPAAGEQMVNFELGVLSKLGPTSIRIVAKSGSEEAVYETEIDIRNPNPRLTKLYQQEVAAKGEWKQAYQGVGMRGTNHGMLEVSNLPPLNLGSRLDYLMRYPYGCIEQTTSSVFPQLYLSSLLELPAKKKENIDKNLRAGVERLKLFQTASGGFAYWPGQTQVNEWGTNYAGHFLLQAKKVGYSLPANLIEQWQSYQTEQANRWTGEGREAELTQAYRLYLLAMAGKPAMGAMNRLKQQKNLHNTAKWQLAAAYHLAGQKEMGQQLTQALSTQVADYRELGGTYGSGIRDQAIILEAMSIMEQRNKASGLVNSISDRLSDDKWLNTQATAYALVGMATYAGKASNNSRMKFSYQLAGGEWEEVSVDKPYFQFAFEDVQKGELAFKNKSGAPLYPRLILDGVPMQGDTSSAAYGVSLDLTYTDMNEQEVNPSSLKQGTDFQVKVVVKNTGKQDYFEMALDQIFPSGWEIHNSRLDGSSSDGDSPEFLDIRDDRVYTFFDLKKGESKTFYVLLNAAYLGRYYLPAVTAEAMYDRSIHAHEAGQWVNVE